jgi:hypothetical protein
MIRDASPPADALAAAMADPRPKIRLPGDDRLLSDFAADVGALLGEKPLFRRGAEAVTVEEGRILAMTPERLRTYVERFGVCFKVRTSGKALVDYSATMRAEDARGCLVAGQFLERLRPLRAVNAARLPVLRGDGALALLPVGYDDETETLTLPGSPYPDDVGLPEARATLDALLAEFCWADAGRSKAVAVSALLGLYAGGLLPRRSLRPCFVFVANGEGAGKSLLASACVVPVTGQAVAGSKADDDDEIRKTLLAVVREGRQIVVLDNCKGRLASGPLEGFLSATDWSGRILGTNETFDGENLCTVIVTGNGLTVSPDMRRRSLFVELHLEVERAEDRTFRQRLDHAALLEARPRVLGACWALCRYWNEQGRPKPSRGHSAFPGWADVVGGIVEAAMLGCPLDTPEGIRAAVDSDGEDMRRLVEGMAGKGWLAFDEVVDLARELGAFDSLLGEDAGEVGRRERSAFGRLLGRYERRLVGTWRFSLTGEGHKRRYLAEPVKPHGQHGQHGLSHCSRETLFPATT